MKAKNQKRPKIYRSEGCVNLDGMAWVKAWLNHEWLDSSKKNDM